MRDLDRCSFVDLSYACPPTIAVGDVRIYIVDGLVVLPGTRRGVIADWIRDLSVQAHVSTVHALLGKCHAGCLDGAEAVLPLLLPAISDKPYEIVAHSLGAGIGVLLAAMLTLTGMPPTRITTFGAMRCSIGPSVAAILANVPGTAYRHADDPVVLLPNWPYTLWRRITPIGVGKGVLCVADHYIDNYVAALAAG